MSSVQSSFSSVIVEGLQKVSDSVLWISVTGFPSGLREARLSAQ